jgi:hypothetical protein
VQNYLAGKASAILSERLKTKVTVAHVRIDFLNHFLIQGLYIADQANDTLLYAGEAQIRISDWFIFKKRPVLHYMGLENAYVHLYRTATSNVWNYDFISDAFKPGKKDTSGGTSPDLNLEKIALDNVRFHMDDKWGGEDIDVDVGYGRINGDNLDVEKKVFDLSSIAFKDAYVLVREYHGGKPRKVNPPGFVAVKTYDDSPYNPDKWVIRSNSLTLADSRFTLTADTTIPLPGYFDADHIEVSNIQIKSSNLSIIGDTIRGHLENLTARDRCGIAIKSMRSDISVSPVASICKNLALETNYSKVSNYYAMLYKRFPDFLDYIDSVTMVGHMTGSTIDERDILYFAPQLKNFPAVQLQVSGDGRGTVADLSAQHLVVTDGVNYLKGSGSMKGLPDIYKTWITFTDGEITTSGPGILKYAPSLRNNPDLALEELKYATFHGNYEGYVEDFSVHGDLTTNLGNISANMKLNIPGFSGANAVYSGVVTSTNFQVGAFFRKPLLGAISLKEDCSGVSFDPDHLQLNIDGEIGEFGVNGYPYHHINTHGTLAKKQFNGEVMVDDPNLALEFNGTINYNDKNVNVKAMAHLLSADFKALNITADTFTASADLDLNCTGSNIDNFSGYARLDNITMKRNSRRLALDSVLVNASLTDGRKLLTIESNDVSAKISGSYQLSKLPASIQYYLSRYIPNFIKAPAITSPDQDFEFSVNTRNIDSLFALTYPLIRGFDSSTVTGALNSSAHKLSLVASVPYGSIGKFHMSNIAVSGQGNLDVLGLNTTIDNVAVGDSSLSGSLSVTTTVTNDSVSFTIATTTTDNSDDITLNGNILARKDSLFLSLLPSEFYLNQVKWDIAGGSKVVYSDKYLLVQDLLLSSGLQRISAGTELHNNDKSLIVNVENLDLGQLGSWAGFAGYQPDGRANGTVTIDKIFQDLYVSANIKATGVKLGAENVGEINLIGTYDGSKKLISLDPQTGVYRDNASIVASGNISFDSATHQKLDGHITFNNTPVAWSSPFLTGVMSHLSGTVNGSLNFGGSAYDPVLDGSLSLADAGLRLDYLGCNYTIPSATVHIDNRRISFGKVTVNDAGKNTATLTGYFSHNMFRDMRMHLTMKSDKFEVMNLTSNDNALFYGNIIAGVDSFTIKGPFNNIDLAIVNAYPAAKSRFYITESTGGDLGSYSYVSFKTYGKLDKPKPRNKYKINVSIDANLTALSEMHIVLDPASGDEIMTRGSGRIQLDIPPNNDINITGVYNIDDGVYLYTLKRFGFYRQFKLTSGNISFNGPFAETGLDVNAVYSTKARLIDLLTEPEKNAMSSNDQADAETPQMVDVVLHMNGLLNNPKLTYDLDLEDKHSQSTVAYSKLQQVNADDQQKTYQVAALLLINSFITPEGIGSGTALTGGINNVSQVISGSMSSGLTNVVNKLTGNKQLNVDVKYENYANGDQSSIAANRNLVSVGVNKNFFNDRLGVELGSTSDWGKPASASSTTNFNITGDFRIQYLLSYNSGLRLNAFRTSDYDVTLDKDIQRSGVGISWRKSFDNFNDFFKTRKALEKEKQTAKKAEVDTTAVNSEE